MEDIVKNENYSSIIYYLILIVILITYPIFISKGIDLFVGDKINCFNDCKLKNTENGDCYDICDSKNDVINWEKHTAYILIGLITFIISSILVIMYGNNPVSIGFLLGSFICIIIGISSYWYKYNKLAKVSILGLVLAIMSIFGLYITNKLK